MRDDLIVTGGVGSVLACDSVLNPVMDPVSVLLSTHVAATVSINEPKNPKIASRTITRVRRFVLVFDCERCTGRTCVPISWIARCCIPVSCVLMSCILIRSYSLQDIVTKLEVLMRKSATCPQFFCSFTKRNANGSAFGSCGSIHYGISIIVPHFSGKNTLLKPNQPALLKRHHMCSPTHPKREKERGAACPGKLRHALSLPLSPPQAASLSRGI